MPRPTSAGDRRDGSGSIRVVFVTLDNHLASTVARVERRLQAEIAGLTIKLHAAAEFTGDPVALQQCTDDIASADIVVATMLFMDDHIRAVMPALEARRERCDALVAMVSAGEIVRLTRIGGFKLDGSERGAMAFLKRLRGARKSSGASSGASQMAMLKRIPQILRFIPGTAQDARAYFLAMQYWLAGSEDNIANMVRMLVDRYARIARGASPARLKPGLPIEYPDVGVYHPRLPRRIADCASALAKERQTGRPRVGLLLMRSYVLAGNTAHYDGVIAELESLGLDVIPAFASGLDARPAIERFFMSEGRSRIDALVSLTGFSLVGGPAYNDATAAEAILAKLDVPYVAAHALEFQTIEQWRQSEQGLLPVESTMMIAIPELDGAIGSIVYGGRAEAGLDMVAEPGRVRMLARRVKRLVDLRRAARAERRIAIVLFNFPPNAGSVGTAAYLGVFESLFNTLKALASSGYRVDVPANVEALRAGLLEGNAARFAMPANVHARIAVDEHVRKERHLRDIERQWGAAPGRHQTDGRSIFVLGRQFGNVLVGVQPAFGYEGDPMRLLFERGFAPTHAFAAFYRYIRDDFAAHAVLHFGTHGALEFMPGKQTGLSDQCWPDRLIDALPNFYLYAANNPSEGAIAKRRGAATLISYLTPPITNAGLYRGLVDLKSSLTRLRSLATGADADGERSRLAPLVQAQAAALDLAPLQPAWEVGEETAREADRLWNAVLELEYTLIPHGMHVVGSPASREERIDLVTAMGEAAGLTTMPRQAVEMLVDGAPAVEAAALTEGSDKEAIERMATLALAAKALSEEHELPAMVHALDAGFVRPSPSGDLLRNPAVLPTGRNIHGFDPFRMPSAFAVREGEHQAARLLERHVADTGALPNRVAMVLWGSDNIKSEGGPIAQALAMIGARPRFDSYGRLCGATLIPLTELGRPRIDTLLTLSGIFRDLLPLQVRMLAEAALLAASADEPIALNFVRKHSLDTQAKLGCDMETAALRVFSNAEGAYGSNVNHLIESGAWQDEEELATVCTQRKGFAYNRQGHATPQAALLRGMLANVDLTYQNLESVELGVTTVDHYFDTLGGISRAVRQARGVAMPVYIGDQTRGEGQVRTLNEQVALETRTRMLNPKWYEGLLKHGYEGVRQIEAHVTNTMGWSATTAQVEPWVYQQLTNTFVLDSEMRERLAHLNSTASARLVSRLVEAHRRNYWTPDPETLAALQSADEELEDRLEGVGLEAVA